MRGGRVEAKLLSVEADFLGSGGRWLSGASNNAVSVSTSQQLDGPGAPCPSMKDLHTERSEEP